VLGAGLLLRKQDRSAIGKKEELSILDMSLSFVGPSLMETKHSTGDGYRG
jgi:hypothetical protein